MSQPKEIFVRTDRCMGCHSCEIACCVAHSSAKDLYGAISEVPKPQKRLFVECAPPEQPLPILCRHCRDAPCMHACIAGAIGRSDEGVVRTDADKCIGCWTCVMLCPYGVIGCQRETRKACRCDRCPDRDIPACVAACPTNALVYQSVETYSQNVRQTVSKELLPEERP